MLLSAHLPKSRRVCVCELVQRAGIRCDLRARNYICAGIWVYAKADKDHVCKNALGLLQPKWHFELHLAFGDGPNGCNRLCRYPRTCALEGEKSFKKILESGGGYSARIPSTTKMVKGERCKAGF